jgi:hypothetical protein
MYQTQHQRRVELERQGQHLERLPVPAIHICPTPLSRLTLEHLLGYCYSRRDWN